MKKQFKAIIASALAICATLAAGNNIYATELTTLPADAVVRPIESTLLTEAQVKTQAKALMEEARNRGDAFAVLSYNIDDIYTLEGLGYMIHDYRNGKSISEMLKTDKAEAEARVAEALAEGKVKRENICERVWYLPYLTQTRENAVVYLYEMNGKLSIAGGGVKPGSDFKLKIKKGQYDEIPVEDIAETRYISMEMYNIKATYVRMDDGKEYIIPFMSENVGKFNHLENSEVYTADEFFDHMHNYYDEPTDAEIRRAKAETNENTEVLYSGSPVPLREVPLNQMRGADVSLVETTLYSMVSIGAAIVLVYLLRKWHLEKKMSEM